MEQPKRSTLKWMSPTLLGALLTVLSGVMLYLAPLQDRNAFVMSPGLEGCLAVGSVGLLLALLEGWSYGRVLTLAVPIFGVQVLACRYGGEPWAGMLGLQLLGLGLVGLLKPAPKAQAQETKQPIEEAARAEAGVVTR